MNRKLCVIAAAAAASTPIAARCGDDDESSDSGTEATALSKDEFIVQANDIQGQIDDIRELVPADEADEVNGILDEDELLLQDLEEDPTGVQGDPFAEVNGDLTEYGLSACASG